MNRKNRRGLGEETTREYLQWKSPNFYKRAISNRGSKLQHVQDYLFSFEIIYLKDLQVEKPHVLFSNSCSPYNVRFKIISISHQIHVACAYINQSILFLESLRSRKIKFSRIIKFLVCIENRCKRDLEEKWFNLTYTKSLVKETRLKVLILVLSFLLSSNQAA